MSPATLSERYVCLLQQVAAALLTSSVAAASAAPMHHPTYPASCPDLMILPASLTLGCRPGARTERASWQVHCGLHVRRRPERSHLLPRAEQTVENPPTLSGGTMRCLLCARGAPLCVRTLPSAHGQLPLLLIPCASALAALPPPLPCSPCSAILANLLAVFPPGPGATTDSGVAFNTHFSRPSERWPSG